MALNISTKTLACNGRHMCCTVCISGILAALFAIHVCAGVCRAEESVEEEWGIETSEEQIVHGQDLEELKQMLLSQQRKLQQLESLITLIHASVNEVRDHILSSNCLSSSSSVDQSSHSSSLAVSQRSGLQASAGNELINESPHSFSSTKNKQYFFHSDKEEKIRSDLHDHTSDELPLGLRKDEVECSRKGAVVVERPKLAWFEHFQLLAAVKVKEQVSCLHVLSPDSEYGTTRQIAVGGLSGRVYLLNPFGDLLLDFATQSPASVTVMQSVFLQRNKALLVTGHSNGDVLGHIIREGDYPASSSGSQNFVMESFIQFAQGSRKRVATGSTDSAGAAVSLDVSVAAAQEQQQMADAISNLEIYMVGRIKYLLVSDMAGRIIIFRDNGTLYGVAESPSRPLAFLRSHSTQKMLFLTDSGAASLDLRTMAVRSKPCSGLDGSTVVIYSFDAVIRSKAYGVTATGELIHVVLSGDMLNFECHARGPKRKVEMKPPMSLHGLKGYLLAATIQHIFVYNTTQFGFGPASIRSGVSHPLLKASIADIVAISANIQISKWEIPLLAGDSERLVVLGIGDGYVGVFKSTLPIYRPLDFNTKLWSSPIILSLVVLMGIWFFFGRRKDLGLVGFSEAPIYGTVGSSTPGISKYDVARVGAAYGEAQDHQEDSRQYQSSTRKFSSSGGTYGSSALNFRASLRDSSFYSTRMQPPFSSNEPAGN